MMIIRRALPKRNFTVLPNDVLNNERVRAPELGLLVYLLSLPPDWHVDRNQLMKRFHIGRDGLQAWINTLSALGFIRSQPAKNPETGAFMGKVYFVYDEPLPIVEEGDAPVSDYVNKVDEDKSAETGSTENPVFRGSTEIPVFHGSTASPSVGEPVVPDIYKQKTQPLPKTTPPSPLVRSAATAESDIPEDILSEWRPLAGQWPFTPTEVPAVALRRFAKLTADERQRAIATAPSYLGLCKRAGKPPMSLIGWLKHRGFDEPGPPKMIFVKRGTPAFDAWQEFERKQQARGRDFKLFAFEHTDEAGNKAFGTLKPTLFPPKAEASAVKADDDMQGVQF